MKKTQKKGKNVVAQPKNGVRSRTKVPKTVQQTIPYLAAYSCGTIQVAPTKFARAYLLPDINFRTLGEEDQELIFERFTQLLNSTSNFVIQIATVNHSVNVEEFKEKYFLKFKGDKLDVYRNEVNEIMLKNLNVGNGIKSDKYFVATVNADDIDEAMHQFTSVDTVVADSFRSVGCNDVQPLTMEKWLEVLHAIYHPGHTEEFLCNCQTGYRYNRIH